MTIGDTVRVLAPFADSFPGTHQITDVVMADGEPPVYILGDPGGFEARFLEAV